MSKYLEIQIPQPCSQEWNDMQANTVGRFCDSCQKTVVDFAGMTDEQLLKFFSKQKSLVCGRLNTDQLNRVMTTPAKKIPWLTYMFRVAIPAFLLTAKASARQSFDHLHSITWAPEKKPALLVKADSQRTVTGIILGADGRCIPGASILIEGTKWGVAADTAGNFSIKLTETQWVLRVTAIGYGEQVIQLGPGQEKINVTLQSRYSDVTVGLIVAVKNTRRKKKKDVPVAAIITKNAENTVTVFPNPIKLFTQLNIRWKKPVTANQELSMYNISGKQVLRQSVSINKPISETSFHIAVNAPGYYVLHIRDEKTGKVMTTGVVVE